MRGLLTALLFLIACGFAIFAQIFFEHQTFIHIGVLFVIGSMVITGVLARSSILTPEFRYPIWEKMAIEDKDCHVPYLAMGLAVVVLVIHFVVESIMGHSQYYWFILSIWFISVLIILVPAIRQIRWNMPEKKTLIFLSLFLGFFFYLRFFDLEHIPAIFNVDEGVIGLLAQDIPSGKQKLFYEAGWYKLPNFCFAPPALTQFIFGNTVFGLRVSSAIMGTISLLGVYMLTHLLFNRTFAILVTAVNGFAYAHIHFSRFGGPFIYPLTFGTFIAYFMFKAFREKRYLNLTLAGFLTGISMQTYQASRAMPFIVIAFLAVFVIFSRFRRRAIQMVLIYTVATFVGMGPLLSMIFQDFKGYMLRHRVIYPYDGLGYEHASRALKTDSKLEILKIQTQQTLGSINVYSDKSSKFGIKRPLFDPLTATLFLLALGVAIIHIHSPPILFMIIWILVILVGGGIMTTNAPFSLRLIGIIPPASILLSLIPISLYRLSKSLGLFRKLYIPEIFVAVLILLVGYINCTIYFKDYLPTHPMDTTTAIGRFIALAGEEYNYYFLTTPTFYFGHQGIRFMSADKGRRMTFSDPCAQLCSIQPMNNTVIIINPQYRLIIPFLQTVFSDSILEEFRVANRLLFYTLYINWHFPESDGECLARTRLVQNKNTRIITANDHVNSTIYLHGHAFGNVDRSERVIWNGAIHFAEQGLYEFYTLRPVKGEWSVMVDDKEVTGQQISIADDNTGWFRFTLIYDTPPNPEMFWFGWKTPGGHLGIISPESLRSAIPD